MHTEHSRTASASAVPLTEAAVAHIQTRTVWTLVAGQVLGGLGIGATVSFGALLAADVSGNDAVSGTAATLTTLGAAAAAIPLARLAQARGRRLALTAGIVISALGSAVVILAAAIVNFPLLLAGFALLGVGAAVNLQSRFAATDLATPDTRGRQLSLVVWSTTIGAVVGPNLSGPGEYMAQLFRIPYLTGSFTFAIAAQLLAAAVYLVALRPDPYLLSKSGAIGGAQATSSDDDPSQGDVKQGDAAHGGATEGGAATQAEAAAAASRAAVVAATSTKRLTIFAIGAIAAAQAVMVAVMAMTPLHLTHHGATGGDVGFTISLHIAGMFALSPVFGWLSDRLGKLPTILIGQALLAIGLATVSVGELSSVAVTVGLSCVGLGWSATTVSGSALVASLATDASRTRLQGRTDLVMNIAGAVGGAASGPVLALIGYSGLALAAGVIVIAVACATAGLAFATASAKAGSAKAGSAKATSATTASSRDRDATTPR